MSAWFVTGTDTCCGKTAVSVALVKALNSVGNSCGYKPIAAGCEYVQGKWANEDALALQQVSHPRPEYEQVNPFALKEAIAPHIAAKNEGVELPMSTVRAGFDVLQATYANVVVEGAGGWYVPLSLEEDLWFSDVPKQLGLPVIMVVGVKLGCINHATLTAKAILASGNRLVGWVANVVDPAMDAENENLKPLQHVLSDQLQVPQIAQFNYEASGQLPPENIRLDALMH